MKAIRSNLGSLFLIFGLFWISINSNSQDIKLSRQERKEAKKAEMAANFNVLDSLLNAKSFVLEADYLQNKYGMLRPVLSTINFIRVDESKGTIQTGSESRIGYNGVGGVTAEGSIGKWKITKDTKRLTYTLSFNIMTNIGNFDIFMTVYPDNHAVATISGTDSGKLTWDGHLVTVYNSRVYKGYNTI